MHFRLLPMLLVLVAGLSVPASAGERPRARDLGIVVGALDPGPLNAITDVAGVRVGQITLIRGDSVHTGVTVILPHAGNLYQSRVPAAVVVGNGYGKLVGYTQIAELGELETPIALTNTLAVWRVADGLAQWMLHLPGMEMVRSINPVVAETNDGSLNAIRTTAVTQQDLLNALAAAAEGPVAEGSVGAGTGTVAFQWKGGIGTSSRLLVEGPWRVGVLVQSNFGRWQDLRIEGAPVGRELGRSGVHPHINKTGDGSIVVVIATDAPLSDRNLKRLAARALLGIGRTGGFASNGSGDYVIAFSTHPGVRRPAAGNAPWAAELGNAEMNPLFEAAVDATVEAIYNSLLRASNQSGAEVSVEALPIDEVHAILCRYGIGTTTGKGKR
ncbi:MAG TPA: P1 family peptidase [bacterium]|nr:P1 family peptidase [bacterium]HQG45168.1 P1 family peptidase [bacterium]HQI48549.1 P1 family peptidase [bacterium]HQJ63672.1 P1 family peptidase [bacterium]